MQAASTCVRTWLSNLLMAVYCTTMVERKKETKKPYAHANVPLYSYMHVRMQYYYSKIKSKFYIKGIKLEIGVTCSPQKASEWEREREINWTHAAAAISGFGPLTVFFLLRILRPIREPFTWMNINQIYLEVYGTYIALVHVCACGYNYSWWVRQVILRCARVRMILVI